MKYTERVKNILHKVSQKTSQLTMHKFGAEQVPLFWHAGEQIAETNLEKNFKIYLPEFLSNESLRKRAETEFGN